MATEANKAIIKRYYEELWNAWNLEIADEIISGDIVFRGSLSVKIEGRDGFKEYVEMVREAFPDFHNQIEDMVAEDAKVVAHLTYTGTHEGVLFDVEPTGRKVKYEGIAIFRIADGQITNGLVIGDTLAVMLQISAPPEGFGFSK